MSSPDRTKDQATHALTLLEALTLGGISAEMQQLIIADPSLVRPLVRPLQSQLKQERMTSRSPLSFQMELSELLPTRLHLAILRTWGIEYVGELTVISEDEFMMTPNLGLKSLAEVSSILARAKLTFRTDQNKVERLIELFGDSKAIPMRLVLHMSRPLFFDRHYDNFMKSIDNLGQLAHFSRNQLENHKLEITSIAKLEKLMSDFGLTFAETPK